MTDTTHAATTPLNIETNRYSIEEKMKTLKDSVHASNKGGRFLALFSTKLYRCVSKYRSADGRTVNYGFDVSEFRRQMVFDGRRRLSSPKIPT